MKVTSKTTTTSITNRVSALKRLSKPTPFNKNNNSIHHRLSASTNPIVTDARELITNRNKPIFDARQLLSRQSSKTFTISPTDIITRKNLVETEEDDDQEMIVSTGFQKSRLTSESRGLLSTTKKNSFASIRNSNSTEPISFTKTITNTSVRREDDDHHLELQSASNQKVVISFVNDDYHKKARSPSPPPIIRRLHDASIQTARSSRSPIRMNSHRRHIDEQDDLYEPAIKRTSSRKTISDRGQETLSAASKGSVKRTSTGAAKSTRVSSSTSSIPKQTSSSDSTTILVTNLQSSVTEDDIIELFGEVGRINDITTLSPGCVQITYSKQEHAEQAVVNYHNRLLDGKFIYVSLQQPLTYSTKSSKNSSSNIKGNGKTSASSSSTNESLTSNSNKLIIDPAFIRQALFNPSNNTTNPVQFQVKL